MSVRALFICQAKEPSTHSKGGSVMLSAVTADNSEAEEYFNATPFGEIRMGILNPSAFDQFEVGDRYYVDFEKVEKNG